MYIAAAKRLTHRGAKQMAATAIAKAEEAGIAITVAIADAGGHLILLERMDGGRFHTVHSSTTKAVCAASNKRPTTAQGAQAQPLDVAHAIGLALAAGPERWTAMEGGFPVIVEGECIGGIGVSGGDWETDARIAKDSGRLHQCGVVARRQVRRRVRGTRARPHFNLARGRGRAAFGRSFVLEKSDASRAAFAIR